MKYPTKKSISILYCDSTGFKTEKIPFRAYLNDQKYWTNKYPSATLIAIADISYSILYLSDSFDINRAFALPQKIAQNINLAITKYYLNKN